MGLGTQLSPFRVVRSSFSRKLAVLFLLVLLIVAAVGGVIYVQTGASLQESTEQEMRQSTVLQANTVAEWVDRMNEKTQYISSSDLVASDDTAQVEDYLQTQREESPPSVTAIHYYDTGDHEVVASSEDGAAGVGYGEEGVEWASGDLSLDSSDDTVQTHPYEDPATETKSVAFVSPVPDEADRAVVLVVDLEEQVDQLEPPATSEMSFTHVVDDRGTVVMSHHKGDINTQNMGPEDEYSVDSMGVMQGLDGETGYAEMEMDHGGESMTMTMGFAPVADTDWVIMTHVPADAAFALQENIERSVIALVLLSVVGLGVVGAVIGRNTTRPIKRLAEQASELEDGNLDAELETNRTDEIGQLYDSFDGMRTSLRERIEEVETAKAQAEEARDRADRLNQHLEEKADEYADVMQECGDGDLTQRMDPESENEAMSEIAVEFNRMIAALEDTVDRLSGFAAEVAASSDEVTASTEEVRSASAQVTESIQEISEGAERQNENLQEVNEEMNGLSTTTEEIAASSNTVADLAAQTAETGREGREAATETVEGMNEVEADSERTMEAIEALESEIAQIDELVEFISELAQQTNMLALNATIEASRSAESGGEGFSAVADEVKDLAEETKQAAENIEQRIENIKSETDRTTSEVRQTRERITHYQDTVENTVDALEKIANYADETSEGVQEISAATEQQAASTQEVVAMVDEAATISEETTTEAETVAAAGEEQTSALTEVSRSISDLSQQASELSSSLDEFETEGTPDRTDSDDADAVAFDEADDATAELDEADDEATTVLDGADDEATTVLDGADDEATTPSEADDVTSAPNDVDDVFTFDEDDDSSSGADDDGPEPRDAEAER